MRLLGAAGAAVLLAACATAVGTAYQPVDTKGYGYSETRIERDRYRVVFAGDGATPPEAVEDFALLRAAELALQNGYDWFRVVGRSLDYAEKGGVGVGAGFGTGSYGRRSGVSVGVGGDLGTIGARKFYTARLEVIFGEGEPPEDEEVYDALEVTQTVRARIGAAGGA
ncbi:CC0125/CC1285 family lipoprotein [Amphiplicatus metriothermophilus]|uniref:Lipoprotein n=1 Tax=Amphiplicatus metriothermophilus TaxID=1519374 RepID=A0A239PZI1_9PROT|nr:hypothetical protein [Amphiplicatus metriothermophilus]MBB5519872.1 hypothetical protein [Amphiplicatus metriothermophilus]SNT75077.1 hypothetical protein SAMN06297382_2519 [Amphiplicatus metriothermophilus]